MSKPLTATEIKESWVRGCTCGGCDYCYVRESIKIRQEAIFYPLIGRVKELLKRR